MIITRKSTNDKIYEKFSREKASMIIKGYTVNSNDSKDLWLLLESRSCRKKTPTRGRTWTPSKGTAGFAPDTDWSKSFWSRNNSWWFLRKIETPACSSRRSSEVGWCTYHRCKSWDLGLLGFLQEKQQLSNFTYCFVADIKERDSVSASDPEQGDQDKLFW